MNDWFEWNGIRSTDFGVYVTELPAITIPAEKSAFVDIPGRSGSLTILEGEDVYADMTLSVTCFIADTTRITEIAAWLHGSGTVTFANRQGGFYYARIVNQIPIAKILRGNPACSFAVNFRCKPFFYLCTDPITIGSAGIINNPTDFNAFPIITVTGNAENATVMIGTYSIFIDKVTTGVTIDCENMIGYSDDPSSYPKITVVDDEWPMLLPGTNLINCTSGIVSVRIRPNWRTL